MLWEIARGISNIAGEFLYDGSPLLQSLISMRRRRTRGMYNKIIALALGRLSCPISVKRLKELAQVPLKGYDLKIKWSVAKYHEAAKLIGQKNVSSKINQNAHQIMFTWAALVISISDLDGLKQNWRRYLLTYINKRSQKAEVVKLNLVYLVLIGVYIYRTEQRFN